MKVAKVRSSLQPGKGNSKKLIIRIVVIFLLLAGLILPGTSFEPLKDSYFGICPSGSKPGNQVFPVSGQVLCRAGDEKNSFFQWFRTSSWVLAGTLCLASSRPTVYFNGEALKFDVSPLFHQETPMFPLRGIFEECGFTVTWDAVAKKVVLLAPGRVVYISPDNPLFSINGVVYRMSRPPENVQGRIMVGLDFLQKSTGWRELTWDENENALYLKENLTSTGEPEPGPWPEEDEIRRYDLNFVEVLLPSGEQVVTGENFKIIVTASFVQGVYAYAVHFSYDPEQVEVLGLQNPSFVTRQEFAWQKIDNAAGTAEYLQTALGYLEKITPRDPLVVLEMKALCAGELSLPGKMLEVTLLDRAVSLLPAGLEEKTLRIDPAPASLPTGLE